MFADFTFEPKATSCPRPDQEFPVCPKDATTTLGVGSAAAPAQPVDSTTHPLAANQVTGPSPESMDILVREMSKQTLRPDRTHASRPNPTPDFFLGSIGNGDGLEPGPLPGQQQPSPTPAHALSSPTVTGAAAEPATMALDDSEHEYLTCPKMLRSIAEARTPHNRPSTHQDPPIRSVEGLWHRLIETGNQCNVYSGRRPSVAALAARFPWCVDSARKRPAAAAAAAADPPRDGDGDTAMQGVGMLLEVDPDYEGMDEQRLASEITLLRQARNPGGIQRKYGGLAYYRAAEVTRQARPYKKCEHRMRRRPQQAPSPSMCRTARPVAPSR